MNRVQIVHVKWPFWPLQVEEQFRLGLLNDRLPRFALYAADPRLAHRHFKDVTKHPTAWMSKAGESFAQSAAAHFFASEIDCILLVGADRLSRGGLGDWLQIVEAAAADTKPLCLFLLTALNPDAFRAQRLRSCRLMTAAAMEFVKAGEEDVAVWLEEAEITTWRSIRDKQLRREICQGIQSATDGELAKVINLLGHAQQDGSVLLEQSRMVEFVSTL